MSTATLNGIRATSARANIPAWGCWYAEASIDGEHVLEGPATLKIADLTLVGTVLSGGPTHGRSVYRIVGGKGGWGRSVPKKGYANDAGVKVATIVGDAAKEVGESLGTISASDRAGPAYARQAGPASRVLQDLAPRGWYVNEAGVTQLGARPAGALVGKVTRIDPYNKASGKVVLAAESISTILPGVVVDGITAVDVLHEISATGGLRSTVWGSQVHTSLEGFKAIFDQLYPDLPYRGWTEYRVVTRTGSLLNLQPVRTATGMPDLERVPVRPGVAGCEAEVALGSRVLVGFVDSDAARPFVCPMEDADGAGYLPATLNLLEGSNGVARVGDEITITSAQLTTAVTVAGASPVTCGVLGIKGTISSGSTKVQCG